MLIVAAMQAFGDTAAVNVRHIPGFFDHHPEGLTNATHFVFLSAIPIMILALSSLAEILGMSRPEPAALRQEQAVWRALGFRVRDILVSDQLLPRLILQLLAVAAPALVGGLPSLTESERVLARLILAIWVTVELLRLAIVGRRLARTPRHVSGGATAALLVAPVVVGIALGSVILLVWPRMVGPDAGREAMVVGIVTALVSHSGLVWLAVGGLAALGVALTVLLLRANRSFGPALGESRPHPGWFTRWLTPALFPVASPQAIWVAWRCPEVRMALLAASALWVVRPHLEGSAATGLVIVVASGFMAFLAVRLAPHGIAASLLQLRHHFEQGHTRAVGLLAVLAWASALKALPFAVASVALVCCAAIPLATALALPVIVLGATLAADAAVATAATASLTERRLMILAFLQAAGCMPGVALANYHAALGWGYGFLMFGVFIWLGILRLSLWRPRTRW